MMADTTDKDRAVLASAIECLRMATRAGLSDEALVDAAGDHIMNAMLALLPLDGFVEEMQALEKVILALKAREGKG